MIDPKTPSVILAANAASALLRGADAHRRLRRLVNSTEISTNSDRTFQAYSEYLESITKANAQLAELAKEADQLRGTIVEKLEVSSPTEELKVTEELQVTLNDLEKNEKLQVLTGQVHPLLFRKIQEFKELRDRFLSEEALNFFVMSIDIRHSTELMLKARKPKLFAEFLSETCFALREIVVRNFGIFDKFTGDGILAYFPDFFSGEDGGLWAVKAAGECHSIFEKIYADSHNTFIAVPASAGLGIGIDYGEAHLLRVAGSLTVIGSPVVYACRMGGAPARATLLNQPAYEQIAGRFQAECTFTRTTIDLKHEGPIVAYTVGVSPQARTPKAPPWIDPETATQIQK